MEERILEVVKSIRPDVDFENETALIDDEILDSFDVIQIVTRKQLGRPICVDRHCRLGLISTDADIAVCGFRCEAAEQRCDIHQHLAPLQSPKCLRRHKI